MIIPTIEIPQEQFVFLKQYKALGFENQDSMIAYAIQFYQNELLRHKELVNSANLYAEIYENDAELQELTESALITWQ